MATAAHDPIVILSYARTPMGAFQGQLAGTPATELGAAAVKAAMERAGVSGDQVDKIFMGCVLPPASARPPRARPLWAPASPSRSRPPPSTRSAAPACRPPCSPTT
jgi:acetyl-CoA acetyltransferase